MLKQKQVSDEVRLEQNLKSELESKKEQLERLRDQVLQVRRISVEESNARQKKGGLSELEQRNLGAGIEELK